ncbi:MAG: hypothetical protein H7070_01030 [Saprospiraceae bacterium]|nr:hypothetical protein [Pyrinomonadaceae bacterium]
MAYIYQFQVSNGLNPVSLWAWKWGHWKLSAKWTSIASVDADFSTDNAKQGLERGQNLLMLAVPANAHSPFAKGLDFDKLVISTFKSKSTTSTPERTTTYYHAKVVDTPILRDFSKGLFGNRSANFNEVLLTIDEGVNVS